MCITMRGMTTQQNASHTQELIALRHGRPVPEILRDLHVSCGMSQVAVAAELGVTRQTVAMWLREYGIRRDPA